MGLCVPTVGDKTQEFPAGHQPVCNVEGVQQGLVLRGRVVKRKTIACMADRVYAAIHRQPLQAIGMVSGPSARGRLAGRKQRATRPSVQDIGLYQLLVLFLMVQAKRNQAGRGLPTSRIRRSHKAQHGGVDMLAVGVDVGQRWPRQHASLRPWVARTQRFVIRVKEVQILRVEELVAGL